MIETVTNAATTDVPWPGRWVSDHLDVHLHGEPGPLGLTLPDLVGLAVRRNPRRAHLLVSRVLGKHVPTDPRLVYGAGLLLGARVGCTLAGDAPRPDLAGGALLRAAVNADSSAASALVTHVPVTYPQLAAAGAGAVVVGYAETATGLGHAVADALDAPYLHSTRRPVAGVAPAGGFEEEHSHATSHLLLPEDPALLAGDGPLVLVDDELSTGRTALNTIAALHRRYPRRRYVIAALVDLRSAADRDVMAARAAEIGARIDLVALAAGQVRLPADVLTRAAQLAATLPPAPVPAQGQARAAVTTLGAAGWPVGVRESGRLGFTSADRASFAAAAARVAATVSAAVEAGSSVLVLGTEELMAAPTAIGCALAGSRPDLDVRFSTTTRSPVLAVDDPGYAIAATVTFPAHDAPADGPGPRYAHNLRTVDTVVLVTDSPGDTPALWAPDGLVAALRVTARSVLVVTVPQDAPE